MDNGRVLYQMGADYYTKIQVFYISTTNLFRKADRQALRNKFVVEMWKTWIFV